MVDLLLFRFFTPAFLRDLSVQAAWLGGQFAGIVGTLARGWLVHSGIWRHVGLDTRVTDAQRHAHGLSVPLALAEGRHALPGDHLATASSWAISALFLSRA